MVRKGSWLVVWVYSGLLPLCFFVGCGSQLIVRDRRLEGACAEG